MSRCSTMLRSGSAHGSRLGSARLANASPFYSHSAFTRETAPPPLADGLALLGTAAGRRSPPLPPPLPPRRRRRPSMRGDGRAPEVGRARPKVAERASARASATASDVCPLEFVSRRQRSRRPTLECARVCASRFRAFNIVYFTAVIMELRWARWLRSCGRLEERLMQIRQHLAVSTANIFAAKFKFSSSK